MDNTRARAASLLVAGAVMLGALSGASAPQGQEMRSATEAALRAAPAELLTPFEAKRHQTFIDAAHSQRPIDLLFLGGSAVEFWRQEGKAEWAKNYSGMNAENFGVQGATTRSLLWRLQNGELDGFEAKVIVLDALWAGDMTRGATEQAILEGNDALVAEIHKRQPGARILLVVVPRMGSATIQATLRKRFAQRADGVSTHFVDLTNSFVRPDGSFDTSLNSGRGSTLSAAGYALWAQALRPKLTELLVNG